MSSELVERLNVRLRQTGLYKDAELAAEVNARIEALEAENARLWRVLRNIAALDDNSLHYGPYFARRAREGGNNG